MISHAARVWLPVFVGMETVIIRWRRQQHLAEALVHALHSDTTQQGESLKRCTLRAGILTLRSNSSRIQVEQGSNKVAT